MLHFDCLYPLAHLQATALFTDKEYYIGLEGTTFRITKHMITIRGQPKLCLKLWWLVFWQVRSLNSLRTTFQLKSNLGGWRDTPGAYCIKLLTGENSGYFLPEFFPVLKSMAESC